MTNPAPLSEAELERRRALGPAIDVLREAGFVVVHRDTLTSERASRGEMRTIAAREALERAEQRARELQGERDTLQEDNDALDIRIRRACDERRMAEQRAREAEEALADCWRERNELSDAGAKLVDKIAEAEQRAAEAERDNKALGDHLYAIAEKLGVGSATIPVAIELLQLSLKRADGRAEAAEQRCRDMQAVADHAQTLIASWVGCDRMRELLEEADACCQEGEWTRAHARIRQCLALLDGRTT